MESPDENLGEKWGVGLRTTSKQKTNRHESARRVKKGLPASILGRNSKEKEYTQTDGSSSGSRRAAINRIGFSKSRNAPENRDRDARGSAA